jgi:hypothetical protein
MREIVDRSLQLLLDADLNNSLPPVHPLMADTKPSAYAADGYENWLPIASTVTDAQLACLEVAIGRKLPPDYKAFLQYKHFYELHIGNTTFFEHPIDTWLSVLFKNLHHGWPREYLIDKGFIPFAMYEDWGMLCFDANRAQDTANYPVVLWDHEQPDEVTDYSASFAELLPQLEAEAHGSSEFA